MQTVFAAGESGSPDTLSTIVPSGEYSASQLQKTSLVMLHNFKSSCCWNETRSMLVHAKTNNNSSASVLLDKQKQARQNRIGPKIEMYF